MNKNTYYCYFLISGNNTYIGITNNLNKRIKQHNGKLKNGAKSTRMNKNKWSYHTIIGEFSTISKAMRFEWYWKHIKNSNNKWTNNKSGLNNKMKRLIELLLEDEWNDLKIIHIES